MMAMITASMAAKYNKTSGADSNFRLGAIAKGVWEVLQWGLARVWA